MHVTKKLCQRCGGSGQALRPLETKTLNFKQCSHCAGKGVRFKAIGRDQLGLD